MSEKPNPFDPSPRRVWTGSTVPGKKMAKMLAPHGFRRGRDLIELYEKKPPYRALITVAWALHILPQEGALGPTFRDLLESPWAQFGATLTDIRDFLKLRFRASGLNIETALLARGLREGALPEGVEPLNPDLVVNYAVSALDALSRDVLLTANRDHFVKAMGTLRDLLRATAEIAMEPEEKGVWGRMFEDASQQSEPESQQGE